MAHICSWDSWVKGPERCWWEGEERDLMLDFCPLQNGRCMSHHRCFQHQEWSHAVVTLFCIQHDYAILIIIRCSREFIAPSVPEWCSVPSLALDFLLEKCQRQRSHFGMSWTSPIFNHEVHQPMAWWIFQPKHVTRGGCLENWGCHSSTCWWLVGRPDDQLANTEADSQPLHVSVALRMLKIVPQLNLLHNTHFFPDNQKTWETCFPSWISDFKGWF